MDEDTQQPAPSGPDDYDDGGYATDADPAPGLTDFSGSRQATQADRRNVNRKQGPIPAVNQQVTANNVKLTQGPMRKVVGGPPE